jgi:hypothetical protein
MSSSVALRIAGNPDMAKLEDQTGSVRRGVDEYCDLKVM